MIQLIQTFSNKLSIQFTLCCDAAELPPTESQLTRVEDLKKRRKELIANIVRPLTYLPYMGVPTMASRYLLGKGKLLQGPFSWIRDQHAAATTSSNVARVAALKFSLEAVIEGILNFIKTFPPLPINPAQRQKKEFY